jgi:hypothetical protein
MSAVTATELVRRLRARWGGSAVVTDGAAHRTYACDGLAHYGTVPVRAGLSESAD